MSRHREYTSHADAWVTTLKRAIIHGRVATPRGLATKELIFEQFRVTDPMTFPIRVEERDLKNVIGLVEGLSMIAQVSVPEELSRRIGKFADFEDEGILWGSYGARLHGQIGDLVNRLRADKWSRQGVLTIFDQRDIAAYKHDIPCTVSIQFLVRDLEFPGGNPKLHMKVTMRSNDLWLGMPYDLQQFSILQATLAQVLKMYPGTYTHAPGSVHVYETDIGRPMPWFSSVPPSMAFPLWGRGYGDLAEVVRRARTMLLAPSGYEETYGPALTEFEQWAIETLS